MSSSESIRSPHNARLKKLRALRRGRDRASVVLEGARVVLDALEAGVAIEFVLHDGRDDPKFAQVLARAAESGVECAQVEANLLAEGSDQDARTGLVAVAGRPELAGPELLEHTVQSGGVLLVAAGVQDPGNVGALVRVAAGLGATGVLFLHGSASPWHPRAVRGASGTTFRLPVIENWAVDDFLAHAARAGLPIWTTAAEAPAYNQVRRPAEGCALVLGEEGRGVPAELVDAAQASVGIPLTRGVESLNVATAAAVLMAGLQASSAHGDTAAGRGGASA